MIYLDFARDKEGGIMRSAQSFSEVESTLRRLPKKGYITFLSDAPQPKPQPTRRREK